MPMDSHALVSINLTLLQMIRCCQNMPRNDKKNLTRHAVFKNVSRHLKVDTICSERYNALGYVVLSSYDFQLRSY